MKLRDLNEKQNEKKDKNYFLTNIEEDTVKNKDYRRVLFTATGSQLVLMSIPPKEQIGEEVHDTIDQFIRVEKGKGKLVIDGKKSTISDGSAFIIPKGTRHNVVNDSDEDLKLYSVYSPPNHARGVVQKTKEDSIASEEHFDGKTDIE